METQSRMIEVVCPVCHALKKVSEDRNGCMVQCEQCGRQFVARMADRQLKNWDTPVYSALPVSQEPTENFSFWQQMRWQIWAASGMFLVAVILLPVSFFYGKNQGAVVSEMPVEKTYAEQLADLNRLGEKMLKGIGMATDASGAVELFRQAAEGGNLDAQMNLGYCYLSGKGVEKSSQQAFVWYRRAADSGSAIAQNELGMLWDAGIGVARSPEEAVKWYVRAADQGYAPAQFNLGVCYAGGSGVEKDPVKAVAYYRLAAKQEYAAALNNLGVCYAEGIGVARDDAEAAKLFLQAAQGGSVEGKFNCGVACYTGRGREKDQAQAFRFFRNAADLGNVLAQYNLGVYYENAIIVQKNPTRARFWYHQAMTGGDERAAQALKEVRE